MLILKRLAVWFIEIALEALLIGFFLIVLFGNDQHAFIKDLLIYAVWIGTMFFATGYLLNDRDHSRVLEYPEIMVISGNFYSAFLYSFPNTERWSGRRF